LESSTSTAARSSGASTTRRCKGGEIASYQPLDLGTDCGRACGIAARLLLYNTFEHLDRKRHAGGLDHLQIDRCKQPRLGVIARHRRCVLKDGGEIADAFARGTSHHRGWRRRCCESARRQAERGDVEDAVLLDRDDGGAAKLRPPDAPNQRARGAVARKGARRREVKCWFYLNDPSRNYIVAPICQGTNSAPP
jgi:hypothetical protein